MAEQAARPMLFSGPMVRGLLEDRKEMTRRVLREQPPEQFLTGDVAAIYNHTQSRWAVSRCYAPGDPRNEAWPPDPEPGLRCPYGVPGDLLWVRETWCLKTYEHDEDEPPGYYYEATTRSPMLLCDEHGDPILTESGRERSAWRPSIHMPRKASRITLRITDVSLDRLQAISEDDAWLEGITEEEAYEFADDGSPDPVLAFAELWDSINGAGAWKADPWVWTVSFEVIQKNVDEVLADG